MRLWLSRRVGLNARKQVEQLDSKAYVTMRIPSWVMRLLPEWRQQEIYSKRIDEEYGQKIKEARLDKTKTADDLQFLEWEHHERQIDLYDHYEHAFTRRLLRKASKLHVPTPDRQRNRENNAEWEDVLGNWRYSQPRAEFILTEQGARLLRIELHEEQKRRQELRNHHIAWIAAITGLVGTLTGLFAVLNAGL